MRTVRFNAVRIAKISVNLLTAVPSIHAKAAFVNVKTGSTHGWVNHTMWSKETIEKLQEVRRCMERDIEITHFTDSAVSETVGSSGLSSSFEGIAEHLKTTGEIPQG